MEATPLGGFRGASSPIVDIEGRADEYEFEMTPELPRGPKIRSPGEKQEGRTDWRRSFNLTELAD
jgi:hypothetical protein